MNKEEMTKFMEDWRDTINSEVKSSIKTEVKAQVGPFIKKVNTLDKKVDQHNVKINKIEIKMETEQRKKNILLFNVPLLKDETLQTLECEILRIFSDMGVQCTSNDIDYLKRLGKNKPGSGPVLVKFALLKKKLEILGKRRNLKDTQYYMNEDFSDESKIRRKELLPIVKQMRDEGQFAIIKFDEIFTKDLKGRLIKVDLSGKPEKSKPPSTPVLKSMSTPVNTKYNKKRTFPISPVDSQMSGSDEDVYLNNYTPNPKRGSAAEEEPNNFVTEDMDSTMIPTGSTQAPGQPPLDVNVSTDSSQHGVGAGQQGTKQI
ncbi:hypothetical protein WDU94_001911 [Cyamophila willieti]